MIERSGSMRITDDPHSLRAWTRNQKAKGYTVALVPTMGYLHGGHLSLLRVAKARADKVIASVFVNPTQFGAGEDLDAYPRDIHGDLEKLRTAGCDLVFAPDSSTVYQAGFDFSVLPGNLSKSLCGEMRPGHFAGVATVVTILLRMSLTDILVLGEKDFQQLQIIRRLVRDLWLDVTVLSAPTVRDKDGVAMSSRNSYLSDKERSWAAKIPIALDRVAAQFASGDTHGPNLRRTAVGTLEEAPIDIEYVSFVDAQDLMPVTTITRDAVCAIAARVGKTRLIDNRVLHA